MKIISNHNELIGFQNEILETSGFEMKRIEFDSQNDWLIKDGFFSHRTGGYFHVVGIRNAKDTKADIFLFQPQSAITGLILCKRKNEVYVLVQARVEPGNKGVVQFGPTIQSTPANFHQVHGGKKASYLSYFYSANEKVIGFNSTFHHDLGKRYYQKIKWLNHAQVDELIETANSYAWCSLSALINSAGVDYILNTDLRALIAIYNWDSLFELPTRPEIDGSEILSYYRQKKETINTVNRFIDLKSVEGIQITNESIFSEHDPGSEVGLFSIQTKHREVDAWNQPLWISKEAGLVLLLCRNYSKNWETEFLLSVEYENGLSGGYCISSSFLRYPNENIDSSLADLGSTINEFYQTDEGGRFLDHEFLYRIAEVNPEFEIKENQFWVRLEELKRILSISGIPNLQLRVISSLLVERLNPQLQAYTTF